MDNILMLIYPVWILGVLLIFLYLLCSKILIPYKISSQEINFQDLLLALNAVIQTEFDLWEKDVFTSKKAITNSNFDNFYYDITEHILNNLSPMLYKQLGAYLTKDAIVTIISRKTKEFLSEKVTGTI